jgi:hypothetical protein
MNTIGMVIAVVTLTGLFPAALQLVWNATVPDVVGSKRIGYWTAVKLALLGALFTLPVACAVTLFKSGS